MTTLIIAILTILSLIFCIIKYPSINIKNKNISTFWIVVLIGALFLIIFKQVGIKEIFELTKKEIVNPIEILILFISVTLISIVLDEVGFFTLLANKTALKANGSQIKLFLFLYFLVAILTVFASNDIIILTFTPFICAFARKTKINPIPYLIAEFVAANTWSTMLVIGNPTNIFLSLTYGIDFFEFFKVMFFPSLISGLVALLVLYVIFRKQLKEKMQLVQTEELKINKPIMIISLIHLIVCTILLAISSFINLEMWIICLVIAISISLILLIINRKILLNSLKRAPWDLIPFILSMFVIVLTLDKHGFTKQIGDLLLNLTSKNEILNVLVYGFVSIFADNLINNIPMSLAAIKVLQNADISSIYAVIIGSNLGAYLTPIGALAGIMWMNILKKEDIKLSFVGFIKYGIIMVPFVALASLLTLLITL